MKKQFILLGLMVIVSLSCTTSANKKQVSGFEMIMEVTDTKVIIKGIDGTGWSEVSYGYENARPYKFHLNDKGVRGVPASEYMSANKKQASRFEMIVEVTDTEVIIKSIGGAKWSEVRWECSNEKPCRFILNQSGVRGAPDSE